MPGQASDVDGHVPAGRQVPVQHAHDTLPRPQDVVPREVAVDERGGVVEHGDRVHPATALVLQPRREARHHLLEQQLLPAVATRVRVRRRQQVPEVGDVDVRQGGEQAADPRHARAVARSGFAVDPGRGEHRPALVLGDRAQRHGHGERQVECGQPLGQRGDAAELLDLALPACDPDRARPGRHDHLVELPGRDDPAVLGDGVGQQAESDLDEVGVTGGHQP